LDYVASVPQLDCELYEQYARNRIKKF